MPRLLLQCKSSIRKIFNDQKPYDRKKRESQRLQSSGLEIRPPGRTLTISQVELAHFLVGRPDRVGPTTSVRIPIELGASRRLEAVGQSVNLATRTVLTTADCHSPDAGRWTLDRRCPGHRGWKPWDFRSSPAWS